jgi:hypothetical protein
MSTSAISTVDYSYGGQIAYAGVSVPDSSALRFTSSQSFTLACWINVAYFWSTQKQAIIAKSVGLGNPYGLYVSSTGQLTSISTNQQLAEYGYITQGIWMHVAVVQDRTANTQKIYINGAVSSSTGTAQPGDGTGPLWIGRDPSGNYFSGQIADVRIYNIALTATQVMTLAVPIVLAATPSSSLGTLFNAGVSIDTVIAAKFQTPITTGSLTLSLVDSNGNTIATSAVSYNSSTYTATWTPSAALTYGMTYTATISGGTNSAGAAMVPFVLTFTTDAAPLAVSWAVPGSGASGVPISSNITAWFNQGIAAYSGTNETQGAGNVTATNGSPTLIFASAQSGLVGKYIAVYGDLYLVDVIAEVDSTHWTMSTPYQGVTTTTEWFTVLFPNYPSLTLSDSGGSVAGGCVYSQSLNAVIFVPSSPLSYATTYTASLSGATTAGGSPMAAPITWSFTTAPSSAALPVVSAVTPVAGAVGVAIASTITATFGTSVNPASIGFTLTGPSGSVAVTNGSPSTTAVWTPTAPLAYGAIYTATITGGLNADGTGPISWSFTTLGPAVTATFPPAGANGVPTNAAVTATFSEAVTSGSITFTLASSAGSVPATVTYSSSTHVATLTPTSTLACSVLYTATLSGVTDAAGHTMAQTLTWTFTTAPACVASIVNALAIPPTPGGRLWWNASRLAQAATWWASNSYNPSTTGSYNPCSLNTFEAWAFAYLMTGTSSYATSAIASLTPYTVPAHELNYTSQDDYRWYPQIALVFDWLFNEMTRAQVAKFTSLYNCYSQIVLSNSWGGPGSAGSNYYWGYWTNSLNFAIASYYLNPMSWTILYHDLVTRWENDALGYQAGIGQSGSFGGKGGVPIEGSDYGRTSYQYPLSAFGTLATMGRDLLSETNWYNEATFVLIYTTSLAPIASAFGTVTYIQFPFGPCSYPVSGFPVNDSGQGCGAKYYSDFMSMISSKYASLPIGQYARQWLTTVTGEIDPWVAAVDGGSSSLAFSGLPLDYYAPCNGFFFTKNTWASTGMSVLLQLGGGTGGSHLDPSWGSFQIYIANQNIAPCHAEYSASFADGTGSNTTTAYNTILYNNAGQLSPEIVESNVLAMESKSDHSYAAVDIGATYVPWYSEGNAAAGPTTREYLFVRSMATLIVVDRLQSATTGVTQSFLLHLIGNPTLTDGTHATFVAGTQQLWLTTLATTGSTAYSVSHEGETNGGTIDVYRLIDTVSGSQYTVFLHVITCGPSGTNPVTAVLTTQGSSTYTVTLISGTASAVLVIPQAVGSTGGTFGYAASGTPTQTALRTTIQSCTVTTSGPVWGS